MRFGPILSLRWVRAALVAYVAGLILFWPRVLVVVDEAWYVSQAVAFAHGGTTIPGAEILAPPTHLTVISNYPPGTSLLQAPFVHVFGWAGAVIVSALALLAATLITARWLRDEGRPEAFALAIPGFFASAFFGRVAMSDMPGMAIVAAACWLLWRSASSPRVSLAAGFVAGASTLFREPLVLLLAPIFIGAMVRRQTVWWAAAMGGLAAVATRLVASTLLFSDPLYVRDPGYGFSLAALRHSVPLYLPVLLVMFPAGAVLPFVYRGPRRTELRIAFVLYVTLFLFFEYDAMSDNGAAKGFILASRFMLPVLPLLTFMAAEIWPRAYGALPNDRIRKRVARAAPVLAAAIVSMNFLIHPLVSRQEATPRQIRDTIYAHTQPDVPVIINSKATLKYLSPAYGPRRLILLDQLEPDSVAAMARRHARSSVAILDRRDSDMFRRDGENNRRFLAKIRGMCELSQRAGVPFGWGELRIYDMTRCDARGAGTRPAILTR